MKRIFVNLKRFDVPAALGGVNRVPVDEWASHILNGVKDGLGAYADTEFTFFFPEAHIPAACAVKAAGIAIGCQGVYHEDVAPGGNFGAFTASRPAAAAKALGCEAVIIGHCEERRALNGILAEAGVTDSAAVNRILNKSILCAAAQGLRVLYCIGETELDRWQDVLREQIETGLKSAPVDNITLAYEPVWAIGPGKTPPGREYIKRVAGYIKDVSQNIPVVYGGGLKADNAAMLSSIPEIDGGLIALTRFSGEIGFYPKEYLEIVRLYHEQGVV